MFYSLFRRPYTARSVPATLGCHASGESGTTAAPAGANDSRNGNAGPSPLTPSGAAATNAPPHPNGSAASPVAQGGDRRVFEGEERLLGHLHAPRQYPLDPEKDADALVLLAQQYSITSVVITHYRVKESYVEYVIECVRGHDAWRVYRRYQQFKALDHDLKQICSSRHGSSHGAYGVVPVLPGSHWMDVTNQSPELVEQRRRYLEIYLQQLLVPRNLFYVARTQLYDFLHDGEVPTHLKLTGIQPLLGLISTHTDLVNDEDDDDAVLRELQETQSRQQKQYLRAAERAATVVSGIAADAALPLLRASGSFPAVPTDCASHAGAAAAASSPVAPGSGRVEAGSLEATAATTRTTSSMPSSAATFATNREPSKTLATRGVCTGTQTTGTAVVDEAGDDGEANGAEGRSDCVDNTSKMRLTTKSAHSRVGGAAFTAADPMQAGFSDERLPPASANCAQCNAEFTSFLYPRRCFFCLVQFCSACLQQLPVLESASSPGRALATTTGRSDPVHFLVQETTPLSTHAKAAGSTVPACLQCAENYSRRLDRCSTAPGGGAYRGMQSTLNTLAQQGPPAPSGRPSQSSPVVGLSPATSTRSCVGEERSPVIVHQRVTNPASPIPHPSLSSPGGALPGRSGTPSPVGFQDFQLLTVIGRGTFGKVLKVQMRATHKVYAMKIMNKATVYRRCMTSYMKEEKAILTSLQPSPYIVRCHYAFQTEYYLVFVLDYLPGGELYDYIYPKLCLSPEAACIYAAELVLALECLHRQDVVHRDLKPENVVLTADGHICLTDFGLARRAFSRSRRRSFVGSPEYVAPETIQGQVQTAAVDWWSFGVMLYEMLAGRTPFHARNNNTVYDNVLHKELALPVLRADNGTGAAAASASQPGVAKGAPTFRGFSPEAVSLLTGLLARDPSTRLQDASAIKRHPFFHGLNWEDLRRRRVPAPCIPGDMRDNDVRHFKREFVSEWASVPPLTNMTRASIEALTKCFDNFPLSRTAAPAGFALVGNANTMPTSSATATTSLASHSLQQVHGDTCTSSLSLTLPPSEHATDDQRLREPVRFFHSMAEAQRSFHGTWHVVSIEVHAVDDGRVIFPWGGDVSGVLVYTTGGRFSLQLTSSARRPVGPVQRVTQLSKEDLCDTYCSYVASFGRFHLFPSSTDDGCGVVRHFSEGNLCPNLMLANTVFQYRMHTEPLHPSATNGESEYKGSGKHADTASSTAAAVTWARRSSTTDAQDGSGGGASGNRGRVGEGGSLGGSEDEEGEAGRGSNRIAIVGDAGHRHGRDAAAATTQPPPSPPPLERRIMLRLSTRPQRALEQDFLAFTSLVFEKVS
ncbi:zinc finger protein kinase-like [Leishmania infantum JPCM5]|uniref:Differentiation_inhibitory_kinase_-_putative n=2 Tax=Leishmania infantum TaxID=5671 RepID=A0A6L0XIN5_LEIIN|nr:zinc finger protein kinase-like [Leishmania infantum JPCM5]CAC9503851.1 differentiation_inhibitory_kinase_-_putative [Leishmania infantum]CAM69401.1 zinc finger protein kinase-like [Leishmania infantum JPCM5]SUZ43343.1 differentiation_inhibitory_kinase_-_putative [Leishmania infantum]|eukprot:XP_001470208.1 zinc finger protein kinase-like [Leishmania infantum JPCM5]